MYINKIKKNSFFFLFNVINLIVLDGFKIKKLIYVNIHFIISSCLKINNKLLFQFDSSLKPLL